MSVSNYISSPGFTIRVADTLTTAVSGFTYATPIICTVTTVTNIQPASILNQFSLFFQFGDGTEVEVTQVKNNLLISEPHTYNWPGTYEIKLAVIPKNGDPLQTFSNNFLVANYIKDSLTWDYTNWPDLSSAPVSANALYHGFQSCPPGLLNQPTPLTFKYSVSDISTPYIYFSFYSSNSLSQPWEVVTPDNKYAQLRPRWRFTDVNGNVFNALTAENTNPVYITSLGRPTTAASGVLVGYTGTFDFYYIDDIPSLNYYTVTVPKLWIVYNTKNRYNPQDINDNSVPSYSNSNVFLSAGFYVKNLSADHFGVSVNGGSIPMPDTVWANMDTNFFVTINGPYLPSSEFSNKVLLNYPLAGPPNPYVYSTVTPKNAASVYAPTFQFSRYDSLNRDTGGYYKNILSTPPLSSVLLSSGIVTTNLLLSTANLETIIEPPPQNGIYVEIGRYLYASTYGFLSATNLVGSYQFDVTDFYKTYFVRKINESFNYGEQLQTYALQPFISDDTNLITFLSAVAGDNVHPTENFGTIAYEKTANYVANTQDVATAGVDQLYSLASLIDTEFDDYNYTLPPVLQRQFDLYSTSHEQLWGTREKYNINFDALSEHTNLGDALTAYNFSDIVYEGQGIVLNDIFNPEFYELLEVPHITSYAAVTAHNMQSFFPLSTYPASAYPITAYPLSAFFGWGVKTPVSNYYRFFVYKPGYSNTPVNNLIDWNTRSSGLSTTLSESVSSLSAWYADEGILENIYSFYLTNGLNLIGSKYYKPS